MLPAPPNWSSPELQVGAYVSNGADLYEVTGAVKVSGAMGGTVWRAEVENCRTLKRLQFPPGAILNRFELVKAAPVAAVPDAADQITWDGAPPPP